MNIPTIQIGRDYYLTKGSNRVPINIAYVRQIMLDEIPVGAEIIPYNSIKGKSFLLEGFRISITKVYHGKVIIGSVENPEYQFMCDDDIKTKTCQQLIDEYFFRLYNNIAA